MKAPAAQIDELDGVDTFGRRRTGPAPWEEATTLGQPYLNLKEILGSAETE